MDDQRRGQYFGHVTEHGFHGDFDHHWDLTLVNVSISISMVGHVAVVVVFIVVVKVIRVH